MLNMLKEVGLGIDDIFIKKLDMDNFFKDMFDEVKSFFW